MPVLRGLKPGQKGYIPPKIMRGPARGQAPDLDPQSLPDSAPYLAINHRLESGIWVMRGGQKFLCNLGGKVTGLHDHQIGAQRGLFCVFQTDPEMEDPGPSIGIYDQEMDPNFKMVLEEPSENYTIVAGLFGTDILFGFEDLLKRFANADTTIQDTLLRIPSSYNSISVIREHEGVALVALVGDTTDVLPTSAVFTYDGVTFTDVLPTINIVRGFGEYLDMMVAIFDGTPNSILIRFSNGTWSAPIAPSGGIVSVLYPDVCAQYLNKLFIPSGGEDMFALDQTLTLTQIPPLTTGITAGGVIVACAIFNGYLYFVWNFSPNLYIGRYDGTTWEPFHKNITAEYTDVHAPRALKQYRGSLWLGALDEDSKPNLFVSNRDDTDGSYTKVTAVLWADIVRPIRDLLVY